jgi:hypothetical protein
VVATAVFGPARTIRFRTGIPWCVGVFLAIRVWIAIVAVLTVGRLPDTPIVGTEVSGLQVDATPGLHNAWDGTNRWDASWLLLIAEQGYAEDDPSAAFFPGYPLAVRSLSSLLGGHTVTAGLLVSNLAFLGALIVLHGLTELERSRDAARRTVLLVATFPTSFFFFAPYAESLFLLTSVTAFWFARTDRWVAGGLAGAAAAITRSVGIVLAPALAVEALQRRSERHDPDDRPWTAWLAGALVATGPLLYAATWVVRGSWAAPFRAQEWWAREPAFPLVTLGRGLALGVEGITAEQGWYWTVEAALLVAVVVPTAIAWRSLRHGYLVYTVLGLLVPLTYAFPARPLLSIPRFLAVIFPAFWVIADAVSTPRRLVGAVIASVGLGTVLAAAFMSWRPVL